MPAQAKPFHHPPKGPARRKGAGHFDAAVLLHLAGDAAGALAAYDRLVAAHPDYAEAHNNAGALRAEAGELELAIAHFRCAVSVQPEYADAHHNLGLVTFRAGSAADAIAPLRRAVELNGNRSEWCTDLANALIEEQRCDEALAMYDRALALSPHDVCALSNRAIALRGLRRHAEAITACRAALEMEKDHLDSLSNLGIILKEVRRMEEAREMLERALRVSPGNPTVRVNLAVLLMEMNRHGEARAIAEQLAADVPDQPEAWNVLGNCALEAGDYDAAESCHRKALARDPRDRNANWNLAVLTLLRGDLSEGFRRFEARKRLVSVVFTRRRFSVPEWDGAPLDGRTVFVHAEQGLGDSIQFIRYAATLKARGAGRVIVECSEVAETLLRSAPGVDEVVLPGDSPPPFDVHAYLMSLPFLCGTTIDTIPAAVPYLAVPERMVTGSVRARGPGVRVGIAWGGNPVHQRDVIRSIALEAFAPLLDSAGVTFFSLQKGPATSQLDSRRYPGIVNLDPMLNDLADTAAAISALDLVIAVDTSVAHLAGALGKPVWVLLPNVPDWRWMRDREDSPWYPTMRLFRQPAPGNWAPAIERVARELRTLYCNGASRDCRAAPVAAAPAPAVETVTRTPMAGQSARTPIEISWPIGLTSGWGTYGLQLALALQNSPRAEPVLSEAPILQGAGPLVERRVRAMRRAAPDSRWSQTVRLLALGNRLLGAPRIGLHAAGRDVGVVFFEDSLIDADALARARAFDLIIAGSTWNTELLKAFGVTNVRLVLQGIDPSIFHPAPRTGVMGDRFLVFSGGKLEFRKGQDIVVEAFRRFRSTHPDATLVTAWHNHWPRTMEGIDAAGYVRGLPVVRDGRCEMTEWLVANGLPADSILDLGLQTQPVIAQALREMDVAVFTNRCEGGTNLVAMEAMACGVPTILSANTGHLNLIGRDTCFPLERQRVVTARTNLYRSTLGWGESDPDEVVALLERAYDDRTEARRRGAEGAALLAQLPWARQAEELLRQLED